MSLTILHPDPDIDAELTQTGRAVGASLERIRLSEIVLRSDTARHQIDRSAMAQWRALLKRPRVGLR